MLVKSLTKKNCKEIGVEYIGSNQMIGGVDYSYKGVVVNQAITRGYGVNINLLYERAFVADIAATYFHRSYRDLAGIVYKGEFDLLDLKGYLDRLVDAVKASNEQAQAPISEGEIQEVTTEIRKQKQAAWHKTEQAKKFAWWEEGYKTCQVIRQLKDIKSTFSNLDTNKDILTNEDTPVIAKRESLRKISNLLKQVQKELEELETLTNSK